MPSVSFAGTHSLPASVVAWIRESEGVTVILPVADARASGWQVEFEAAWITLTVHSALSAVGLTAAVASALSNAGISCNVLAACNHDHLFVPVHQAENAMRILQQLSRECIDH